MKKIVILGSEGYIGTTVVDFLLKKKNYNIKGKENLIYSQSKKFKNLKNYNFQKLDIRNQKKTAEVCKDAYCVVILAGLVGDPITKKYKKLSTSINLYGIKKLIKNLNKINIKKLIFVSTCSNYGIKKNKLLKENAKLEPISLYSKHKVIIENCLLKNNFKFSKTILRFASAFGLSKRMRFDLTVNEFVKTAFLRESLEIYHGQTYRPYCHVIDFAKKINRLLVITRGEKGAISINGEEIVENGIEKNLNVTDLTGAGDLFAAGFLHGILNNLSTTESLNKGREMSSKVIQQIGARL